MQNLLLSLPVVGKWLSSRPMLLRVVENISWLSVDRVLRLGVGLFVGVWVARYLGPAGYGVLNYAVAFVSLFSALATLGLDQIVVRELVHTPEDEGKLVGTSFFLKLMGGVIVLFLATFIAFFVHQGDGKTILMIFFVSLGMVVQAFLAIDFFFQSRILSKYTVIAQNTAFFAVSGIKVFLILMNQPVEWFAAMSLCEAFVAGVFLVFFYNRRGGHISNWKFDIETAKKLLHDSWPLILSSVAITIYMRVDQVMIRNMLGEKEVGWYSAAVSLTEVSYFFQGIFVVSFYPLLVEAKKNIFLYKKKVKQLCLILTIMSIVLITIFSLLNIDGYVITLLFSENYIRTTSVFQIYIFAIFFVFLVWGTNYLLVLEKMEKFVLLRNLIGLGCNIVGNFFLIKWWNVEGAAISTVISYIVMLLCLLFWFDTRKIISLLF